MTAISHDGPRGHGESCSPECQACAAMRPPERKPVAGWAMRCRSLWLKAAGYLAASADRRQEARPVVAVARQPERRRRVDGGARR